jgi:hypothetical protein
MKVPKESRGCEDCANEVCPYVYPLKGCPTLQKVNEAKTTKKGEG